MKKYHLILCEHAFAIYAVLPLLQQVRKDEEIFKVFTPLHLEEVCTDFLGLKQGEWSNLDLYRSSIGNRLSKWFEIIFVPLNFSKTYEFRKKLTMTASERFVAQNTAWFKLKPKDVNTNYVEIFTFLSKAGVIKKLPSEFTNIIAFTKLRTPYLLSPYSEKLMLIMESWDHPMKEPYFACPAKHVAWNEPLKNEAIEFQNLSSVITKHTEKFRYIKERENISDKTLISTLTEIYSSDLEQLQGRKYSVYPMCTSSNYHAFEGELAFLKYLSATMAGSGRRLYVRPYPLAPREDRSKLELIDNVIVGIGSQSINGTDVLDEQAQTHKYLLMVNAQETINVGTTFAIDAALCHCPVLQLKLDDDQKCAAYGDFIKYSQGLHIVKYLWTNLAVSFPQHPEKIKMILESGVAVKYSSGLRTWMKPN